MQNIIELETSRQNINWKNLFIIVSFHLLAIPALFMFSWENVLAMLIGNWIVGSLGIGLGYHRLLTHRSFKAPKWLEYTLTTFGAMAIQDEAHKWVATHRIHHKFVETDQDPHSTRPGFWWAHIGWIVNGTAKTTTARLCKKYVPDLVKDKFHPILCPFFLSSDYHFGTNFVCHRRLGNGLLGSFCAGCVWLAHDLVCKFALASIWQKAF